MKKIVLIAGFLSITHFLFSQVGIGTTTPASSAILDISAVNKGVLIPRVFLTNITNTMLDGVNIAATGLLIYNTNATTIGGSGLGYYYFNGMIWERLITSTNSFDDGDWVATGADIERQSGNVYIGNTNATNNDLYISNQIIDWDNSSYLLDPSSESKLNEIEFDAGSVSDTSIRFQQQDSGIYSPGSDEIAIAINGIQRLNIGSNGVVSIGNMASMTHYNLPTTRGSTGQMLQTDGNGNVSWVNPTMANSNAIIKVLLSGNIGGLVSGTEFNLMMNVVSFNFGGGAYNTVTSEYTIPTSGIYEMDANLHFDFSGATSSAAACLFRVYVNGALNAQVYSQKSVDNTGFLQNYDYNLHLNLNAGDLVTFRFVPTFSGPSAPQIAASDTTLVIEKVY
ncbi:MAG: hypothetical protein R2793_03905 [Flavobacteriaceae bacterium]